jgi:hypothetical protein
VIWFRCKMVNIKKTWNVYLTYNQFLKYGFRRAIVPSSPLKYAHVQHTRRSARSLQWPWNGNKGRWIYVEKMN